MAIDLHRQFQTATGPDADGLAQFLRAAERLPGIQRIRRAMADALPSDLVGRTLVDLGCGPGWETERIAAAHPSARVVGVDHNAASIAAARARNPAGRPGWVCADLTASGFQSGSVDVIRTERALMYLPDLAAGVAAVADLLTSTGTIVAFELDYGGTVLAPGSAKHEVLHCIHEHFEAALPQPWAGRQLPGLLHGHGLDVTAEPFSFTVDRAVWQRIVRDTIAAGVAEGTLDRVPVDAVRGWLNELDNPDFPGFRAVITGILTTAKRAP